MSGAAFASAAAAVSLAQPLIGPLGFLGSAAEPVSIVLVTIVLTFFTLVIGELALWEKHGGRSGTYKRADLEGDGAADVSGDTPVVASPSRNVVES